MCEIQYIIKLLLQIYIALFPLPALLAHSSNARTNCTGTNVYAIKHLLPILVGDYASFHFLVVLADTDSEPGA